MANDLIGFQEEHDRNAIVVIKIKRRKFSASVEFLTQFSSNKLSSKFAWTSTPGVSLALNLVNGVGKESIWLDCGTFDSLLKASNFVSKSQAKQKNKIACLEEIAFRNKWISRKKVQEIINVSSSSYGNYLTKVISSK